MCVRKGKLLIIAFQGEKSTQILWCIGISRWFPSNIFFPGEQFDAPASTLSYPYYDSEADWKLVLLLLFSSGYFFIFYIYYILISRSKEKKLAWFEIVYF